MATNLATFLTQVKTLLGPDDSNTELTDANLETIIKSAVEWYSRDEPDDATEDVNGDGGRYYALASSLTNWSEGFSTVLKIEYPAEAVSSDEIPQYLDPEDWRDDYWDGSTRYLLLPNHAPAATETMRITYSVPYTFSGSPEQTDAPTQHFYAICRLSAGLACQAIAAKYSRSSDSSYSLDSVNHLSRAQEFRQRARDFIQAYRQQLGLDAEDGQDRQRSAGVFVDMDTAPSWPTGRRYLFHGKETR